MYTTTKPPLFTRKKHLREQNHELQQQLVHAQRDVLAARSAAAISDEQARQWEAAATHWRNQYEESGGALALAEARGEAYQRGVAWQKRLFRSWLIGQAEQIDLLGTE